MIGGDGGSADIPGSGRPDPARGLREALRAGDERGRDHGRVRGLAARHIAAPGRAPSGGAGHRAARRAPGLLPLRPGRPRAAHGLVAALPPVLAGASAETETSSEGDRVMQAQPDPSDSLVFECDFDEPPEKVWRALTEPQLLEAWLSTDDAPEILTAEPHRLLRYRWRDREEGRDDSGGREVHSVVTVE